MSNAQNDRKWKVGYSDGSGPEHITTCDKNSDLQSPILTVRWGCSCCQDISDLKQEEKDTLARIVVEHNNLIGLNPSALPEVVEALKRIKSLLGLEKYNVSAGKILKEVQSITVSALSKLTGEKK